MKHFTANFQKKQSIYSQVSINKFIKYLFIRFISLCLFRFISLFLYSQLTKPALFSITYNLARIINLVKGMELNPLLIQHLPENQILREDDHQFRTSAYFQIQPQNFQFAHYDHGTRALKQKYKISKHLYRYFNKRNFLFSRFQRGIAIDQESWYSVIPQPVSLYLKNRFKEAGVKKIFQPFSGVGGIAIHLCEHFEQYIVNDIENEKLLMLRHNMKVYGKNINKLKFINKDFLQVQPFSTDVIIVCPPWGGIDTQTYALADPDEIMKPKLSDILIHAQKFSSEIMLQMPKQTNIGKLIRVFQRVGVSSIFTIQKIMTNQKCSQLFFYLGKESFTRIGKSQFFIQIYKDMEVEQKQTKKKIKKELKQNPNQILNRIYSYKYPNKSIFFE